MKKTIPALKVEEETIEDMDRAIEKYNSNPNHLIKIESISDFRRLAIEQLAQKILQS